MKYVSVENIEKTIQNWAEQQFVKISQDETWFLIREIIEDAVEIDSSVKQ